MLSHAIRKLLQEFGSGLVRNRTSFFADYEGRRLREGITQGTNVPTALERVGDFSKSRVMATDPTTQRPFPNHVIPSYYMNPIGLATSGRDAAKRAGFPTGSPLQTRSSTQSSDDQPGLKSCAVDV